MSRRTFFNGAVLGALLTAVAALPAQAATAPTTSGSTLDTSMCNTNPLLSQPFAAIGDENWYTLAPGQSPDDFQGAGWTLSAGATISSAPLADGSTGPVLNLVDGAQATSPIMCVQADYPTARLEIRDLVGPPSAQFLVSYETATGWTAPISSGAPGVPGGWAVSPPLALKPAKVSGWQPVRFVLKGTVRNATAQIYDLYVDPRFAH